MVITQSVIFNQILTVVSQSLIRPWSLCLIREAISLFETIFKKGMGDSRVTSDRCWIVRSNRVRFLFFWLWTLPPSFLIWKVTKTARAQADYSHVIIWSSPPPTHFAIQCIVCSTIPCHQRAGESGVLISLKCKDKRGNSHSCLYSWFIRSRHIYMYFWSHVITYLSQHWETICWSGDRIAVWLTVLVDS